MAKILVADDEVMIANLISDALKDEGYQTVVAHDGEAVLEAIGKESFDLIILDIMMPKMDGYAVLNHIRPTTFCPILFVTAKTRTLDTLLGLEIGADDYIKKPFVIEELLARVKAHLRREERTEKSKDIKQIIFGELVVYPESMQVFMNHKEIELSSREFHLLIYLIQNSGKVLTREQIFDQVWGIDYSDIGAVTVTIKNIRDKLDKENKMIKTIWGMGYKMVKPLGEFNEY